MPRGVKTARSVNKHPKRELITRDDDDQQYGIVTKLLGNSRVLVNMIDSNNNEYKECRCTIRGSMRRREWVHVNDVVLIALRDFGDSHDIIHRYNEDEVRILKRIGDLILPSADTTNTQDLETDIVFEEEDSIDDI
jgi:translation initiation factor 1A